MIRAFLSEEVMACDYCQRTISIIFGKRASSLRRIMLALYTHEVDGHHPLVVVVETKSNKSVCSLTFFPREHCYMYLFI